MSISPDQVAEQLEQDRFAVLARLDQARASSGRADLELLAAIRAADRGELWRDEGCRNGVHWVAQRLHISAWKARRWIDAAHAVDRLPLTAAALERGVISADKTVELCRIATPETEADLIEWARRVTPAAIRERADLEQQRRAEEVRRTHESRYLNCTADHQAGIYWIEGVLPTEQGAVVAAALDRLADEIASRPKDEALEGDTSDESWREVTAPERRAEALVLLASGQVAAESDGTTVVVHAPLAALSHDQGNGSIDGRAPLHPEVLRKLSCDCRLQFVLEDRKGNALGIGQTSPKIPRWLRRQALRRDGHRCTFAGCGCRRFLHLHHIVHWARRGPTDLDNLTTVCSFHHALIHEGRWSVSGSGANLTWFRPGGRIYQVGPAPPSLEEVPREQPEPLRLIEARCTSRLFLLADPRYAPARARPGWKEAIEPLRVETAP